jgi:hypothetical protein
MFSFELKTPFGNRDDNKQPFSTSVNKKIARMNSLLSHWQSLCCFALEVKKNLFYSSSSPFEGLEFYRSFYISILLKFEREKYERMEGISIASKSLSFIQSALE